MVEAEVSDEAVETFDVLFVGWVVVSEWEDGQQNPLWKWMHAAIINSSFVDSCISNVVLDFKRTGKWKMFHFKE